MKHTLPGGMPREDFLRDYWQQQPLLIKQAFTEITPQITAEELAGLAMEDEVRSRIVIELTDEQTWKCEFGPFEEQTFSSLPDSHWTLLVQDIEKHLPEFQTLLDEFLFLPRWRIDDLMISYATEGGSVGPHVDQYDVFLLQTRGQREWQVQVKDIHHDLIENSEMQILKHFNADECWTLQPGDMLYLPPGIPHHGIALDNNCMTCSVGFRAPSRAELLQQYAEHIADQCSETDRYNDDIASLDCSSGELNSAAIQRFQKILTDMLADQDKHDLGDMLGSMLTEPDDISPHEYPERVSYEEFNQLLSNKAQWRIHPACRMLFQQTNNDELHWYVDGQQLTVTPIWQPIIMTLCNDYKLDSSNLPDDQSDTQVLEKLHELYLDGRLYIDE